MNAGAFIEAFGARVRALPRVVAGLVRRPALSGVVRRGYAVGLFWTIAEGDRSENAEALAEHYGFDIVVTAGPLDADGRSTLIGLAHSDDARAGDRALASCVAHAHPGNWIGAWPGREGKWWTTVVKDGRLLMGPATDRLHDSLEAARAAVAAELADAVANKEEVDAFYGAAEAAPSGLRVVAETIDATLALAQEQRKLAANRSIARGGWPRLRRTKASEYLRRQLAWWAAGLLAVALVWWAVSALVSRADVRNAVAPPPPPPPPPPWVVPVQRLPAALWADACGRKTDLLAREIAGWRLATRECTERMALVRWERQGQLAAFATVSEFENAFAADGQRLAIDIGILQQGNVGIASTPLVGPRERQAAALLEPSLGASAIERRMLRAGIDNSMRIDIRPRAALPARPNDKRPYWSLAFSGDLPAGATLADWARVFDTPGLSLREAKWEQRTLQWSLSGEIFERN